MAVENQENGELIIHVIDFSGCLSIELKLKSMHLGIFDASSNQVHLA